MPQLESLITSYPGDPDASDDICDFLVDTHRLTSLSISSAKVTNDGIAKLTHLRHLKYLQLDSPGIGDASIDSMCKLKNLRALLLNGTNISAKGLLGLSCLPHLRAVELPNELKRKTPEFERAFPSVAFY